MPKFKIGDRVVIKKSYIYDNGYVGFKGRVNKYFTNDSMYWVKMDGYSNDILLKESELELEPLIEGNNKEDNSMKMPKLETGMIVINKHDKVGVVAGNEIWYNDGGIDDVEEVLMYLERNKFDGYIKYIIKNRSGFAYIQHNLSNIKFNNFVPNVEVLWRYEESIPEVTLDEIYKKFGHKVKIVPNTLDKSE